jgi:hypothetical protein
MSTNIPNNLFVKLVTKFVFIRESQFLRVAPKIVTFRLHDQHLRIKSGIPSFQF